MQIFNIVVKAGVSLVLAAIVIGGTACQSPLFDKKEPIKVSMGDTPAVRLNYRYEPDVPAPAVEPSQSAEERNPAIQADFDTNRLTELLDKTIVSPDKKRIVAVYHRITDLSSEYRLDMYTAEGKLLKKMTADSMAVHFPDTIVWSPDSTLVAFVAMIRVADPMAGLMLPTPSVTPLVSDANTAIEANTDPAAAPVTAPTVAAPTGILTFRTEQIYLGGADGGGVKPITQNDGLIYFDYAWSPDSSMLVAMAATAREWRILKVMAETKGEMMLPQGRLRVIEKNGRERRLDDNLTVVRPVWSPDSAKIAAAFETQVRIYDAVGTAPTQAAIPLRNQLLISSQAHDRNLSRAAQAGNLEANAPATAEPNEPLSTLPDEGLLVSYKPIIEVAWTADDLLYFQTAALLRRKDETDSLSSFSRWHRLALSGQASTPVKQ